MKDDIERLKALLAEVSEIQGWRCNYLAKHGTGRTCDCKYRLPDRPVTGEMNGCPQLRDVCVTLEVAISELEYLDAQRSS
jgi:hypothetical protein